MIRDIQTEDSRIVILIKGNMKFHFKKSQSYLAMVEKDSRIMHLSVLNNIVANI